jgi:hypothetical protein
MPFYPDLVPSFSLDPDILSSNLFTDILNLRFHFFWDMTTPLCVISLPTGAPSIPRSNFYYAVDNYHATASRAE